MRMGKIPKAIVEEDFRYLVKHCFHKRFAKQLMNEWEKENIRFQVSWNLGLDGETNFAQRRRRCDIKIKRIAATSKRICWRRAVVCHEMGHALHYFRSNGVIEEGQEHGKEWKKWMASAIKEGVMKECAKKLRSPPEKCIFKQKCMWCTPKDKKVTKYVRKN